MLIHGAKELFSTIMIDCLLLLFLLMACLILSMVMVIVVWLLWLQLLLGFFLFLLVVLMHLRILTTEATSRKQPPIAITINNLKLMQGHN